MNTVHLSERALFSAYLRNRAQVVRAVCDCRGIVDAAMNARDEALTAELEPPWL